MNITIDLYEPSIMEKVGEFLLDLAEHRRRMGRDIASDTPLTWAQTSTASSPALVHYAEQVAAREAEAEALDGEELPRRRRGRPKGSKNAVTVAAEPAPAEDVGAPYIAPETTVFASVAPKVETPAPVAEAPVRSPVDAAKQYAEAFGVTGLATLLRVRYQGQRAGQLTGDDAVAFVSDVATAIEHGVPYGDEDAR